MPPYDLDRSLRSARVVAGLFAECIRGTYPTCTVENGATAALATANMPCLYFIHLLHCSVPTIYSNKCIFIAIFHQRLFTMTNKIAMITGNNYD